MKALHAAWAALAAAIVAPITVAATSPLLAWREPVYIASGLAGAAALACLLLQPIFAGGRMPGLPARRGRRLHRAVGIGLVAAVLLHVGGLWITSPPDVVDALLFVSPTPFSDWGVIAMWALFAAALVAGLRRRMSPRLWRRSHTALAALAVAATVPHAMLIEGTMGAVSKAALCALALCATALTLLDLRPWSGARRRARSG